MKIKVAVYSYHEVEVDEKFAVLAVNHPNHLNYPENNTLHDELDVILKEKLGFDSMLSVHTEEELSTPHIAEIWADGDLMKPIREY